MSIRTIQTASVLDEITNSLFASGIDPTLNQVMGQMAKYFSLYPAGNSLPMPYDFIQTNQITDVDQLNLLLVHIAMNIDFAYQASIEQVAQLTLMTKILASSINTLTTNQQVLTTAVEDLLLGAYNTGGYYYQISDHFVDTSLTDLTMTSAFVNTPASLVTIPTISSLSKIVNPANLGVPQLSASINGVAVQYKTISPMTFATNGLSNTVWEVQVQTTKPSEVVFMVTIPSSNPAIPIPLSEIDITPYGVSPVQVFTQTGIANPTTGIVSLSPFGGMVQTGTNAMSFLGGSVVSASSIQLAFRKTQPDYTNKVSGATSYTYVFGATNLVFVEQVYDNEATWVSTPLSIPTDLANDVLIDAVSLTVNSTIFPDTNIDYYVAQDPGNTTQISDFNWQPIAPIGSQSQNVNTVVQFNGALAYVDYIRATPNAGDLQLIPLNSTNTDLTQQNPTPSIVPGVDVFTLANFTDTPLLNSITLEEGINSTKIYYVPYGSLAGYNSGSDDDDTTSAVGDLDAWANAITTGASLLYGEIDTGNGFFYGGDIGENGVSIYVETNLYLDEAIEPILDSLQKADQNSQTWDVRAYLNGSDVGFLPGRNTAQDDPIDSLLVTWNFNQGKNNVILLINIPPASLVTDIQNPYIGTVNLMQNHSLYQFGTVKLSNWSYVDFFDLEYNTVGTPTTFTIYNSQIISRCQPTTNYRLSYNKPSGTAIEAIRLRADFSRDNNNSYVAPQLNSYSMRFLYGNNA